MASKMASRVFSCAHTPARPPGFPSIPLVSNPGSNRSRGVDSPVTAPTQELDLETLGLRVDENAVYNMPSGLR